MVPILVITADNVVTIVKTKSIQIMTSRLFPGMLAGISGAITFVS